MQLFGASRLVLTALGALLFGFWTGLAITLASTLLSAYVVFLLAGRAGDLAEKAARRLRKYGFSERIRRISTVFFIRQLPLPGVLVNIGLACLRTSHAAFCIGSLLGYVVLAVPAAAVGAGLAAESGTTRLAAVGGALAILGIAMLGLRVFRSRVSARNHPDEGSA